MKRVATVELDADRTVTQQLENVIGPILASCVSSAITTGRAMGSREIRSAWEDTIFRTVRREFEPELVDVFFEDPTSVHQLMIKQEAEELIRLLAEVVPHTTVHYAVEDARKALRVLSHHAQTIVTADVKAAREFHAAKAPLDSNGTCNCHVDQHRFTDECIGWRDVP